MSDDLPTSISALIDVPQYDEAGDFPVERGYIWTACASVENGNPLFWDDDVAAELTDGPIAAPSMLSTWFRPGPPRTIGPPFWTGQTCRCRCTSTSRSSSGCRRP